MIEMAICAVLWSLAGVLIKKISAGPMVIAGTRSLFAAACTLCYMMITKVKFVVNKRVFLGSIFTAATFLLFVSANKMTDAANAIVLQYTQPIFILVFSWIFFKEKLLKKDIAVAFFTLFGVALFVMSILLYSQAATIRAIAPLGIALGISPMMMIALFPAVNGYFFIPNYPTVIAAINFDRTGSTGIGKWILNHSFMMPGLITTVVSLGVGLLLIQLF